jgi:hypothetical protein
MSKNNNAPPIKSTKASTGSSKQALVEFHQKHRTLIYLAFTLALVLGVFGGACGIAFLTKLKKIDKPCNCTLALDPGHMLPVLSPSPSMMRKQSKGVDTAKTNSLGLPIHQRLHQEEKNHFPRYLRKPDELTPRHSQHQQRLERNPELQHSDNPTPNRPHMQPQHAAQHHQQAEQHPQQAEQHPQQAAQHHMQPQHAAQHHMQHPQHVEQHHMQHPQHAAQPHMQPQHAAQPLMQHHMHPQHAGQHKNPYKMEHHQFQEPPQPQSGGQPQQFLPLPKPVDDGPSFNEFDKDFTKLL